MDNIRRDSVTFVTGNAQFRIEVGIYPDSKAFRVANRSEAPPQIQTEHLLVLFALNEIEREVRFNKPATPDVQLIA